MMIGPVIGGREPDRDLEPPSPGLFTTPREAVGYLRQ